MFFKFRNQSKDKTERISSVKPIKDIFENRNKKPTEEEIAKYFESDRYQEYLYLKTELERIGKTDFLWRGNENGWVLSLAEGNGNFGTIILKEKTFVGYLALSRNRLGGLRSDPNFPNIFADIFDTDIITRLLIFSDHNYEFERFILDTKEKINSFPKLIELCKRYP